MRPISIPPYIAELWDITAQSNEERIAFVKTHAAALLRGAPEVSIVMPAYNEEKNILPTLQSIAANKTARSVEIIVVNNNSKDNTGALVTATGVNCIFEPLQGITVARNTGLANARGKYVINADADTLYPVDWIEEMVNPLTNEKVSATYGRFSFIPIGVTTRFTYFFYEYMADLLRYMKIYHLAG